MASSSSASSTRPKNKEEDISVIEYPYPSTFNVANVVTIKLTKDNYELWVEQIWSLVDILELRDFLEKELPTYTSRTDKLLRGWILATLSEDVLKIVKIKRHFSTSRSVMIKIEETLVEDIHERILSPKSETMSKKDKSIVKYMPLYEAAIAGNWEATKSILDGDEEAATAIITENDFSLLHVAVVTGKHIDFVRNLVEYLPTHALILKDESARTALHIAAMVGNTEAVKILKNKNPAPLSVKDAFGYLPLHFGISYEHGDTYLYFKELCNDEHYDGGHVASFLATMIGSYNFDLALDMVKCYHRVIELEISSCESLLDWMVEMPSYFRSGISLNFLESFVYSCVPVKSVSFIRGNSDVENPANNHHMVHRFGVHCKILYLMLWDAIDLLVPSIKIIRQKKLLHHQAVQLLKFLCKAVKSLNDEASFHSRLSKALTKAARHGILEVVEEILRTFPSTIWSRDGSKHNITEIALINRCEKVFNISYQMKELQEYLKFRIIDGDQNSMLHLAGRLAPPQKLNLISGAALQMQRELQWYKEVEKLSNPYLRVYHNSSKETPAMVFTREHKELVVEGEKWMKDTANSCSIAAALIITVVFAAAITVPGGNKDNGQPVFNNPAFLIFAVSDTVALFMSTTSLLMFLSILTARYAEEDFLYTLPKRLVFGLLTLFLSITLMVLAFSTAVYLVFGGRNGWVIIPLAALSCLPVTSFVRLQFPLLIDAYSSTFGPGIFGEQSDRPFHRHFKGFLQYIVMCFASTQKYISHI